MEPNQKLMVQEVESFSDPERYTRLARKFVYLIIIRPDLSFAVRVVSTCRVSVY